MPISREEFLRGDVDYRVRILAVLLREPRMAYTSLEIIDLLQQDIGQMQVDDSVVLAELGRLVEGQAVAANAVRGVTYWMASSAE